MRTYIATYSTEEANVAMDQVNARRERLGIPPTFIRSSQKSLADGKGDLFHITLDDGEPVDVSREYDASYG